MITIQVCVGSSCFLRGSKSVITEIKQLINQHQLQDQVILKGNFCLERCSKGVTVKCGEKIFSGIATKDVRDLFEKEILPATKHFYNEAKGL